MSDEQISVEQIVRVLLRQSILDGLVSPNQGWDRPDPHDRTSGELIGVANLLVTYLQQSYLRGRADMRDRIARVIDKDEWVPPMRPGGRWLGDAEAAILAYIRAMPLVDEHGYTPTTVQPAGLNLDSPGTAIAGKRESGA